MSEHESGVRCEMQPPDFGRHGFVVPTNIEPKPTATYLELWNEALEIGMQRVLIAWKISPMKEQSRFSSRQ